MEDNTQATNTKPFHKFVVEGFVLGFASTAGMMFAFAAYNNRARIKTAVKALAGSA